MTLRMVAVTFFLQVGYETIEGIRDHHWRSAGQYHSVGWRCSHATRPAGSTVALSADLPFTHAGAQWRVRAERWKPVNLQFSTNGGTCLHLRLHSESVPDGLQADRLKQHSTRHSKIWREPLDHVV
jgi:hypothetical protein